ncbi:hypothetical protein WICPIJ_007403 [Wickerhamomyces pijperi]|uniref:Methyltransferase type 11 domain-containing protein n=1 Tax=Wickerhamomyces pijperi TaxID=599730 RepID=A0A9P8TJB0_WICPI|nr:hypothetical protein WICPIJ_007403 [Wickerhamomyces pijperi]
MSEDFTMDESLDPAQRELTYVHKVYNEIAEHFSDTRYKPWPVVTSFLQSRTSGSVGIDVGCGNGKYLGLREDLYMIGSDRSSGLIGCAKDLGKEVMVSDGLSLPHPNNRFDFAISIAVIHHFSTPERRTQAIAEILSKLRSGGEVLLYVWALEQEKSRRGYKEGDPQDVLVPWVLQKKVPKRVKQVQRRKGDPKPEPKTEEQLRIEAEEEEKRKEAAKDETKFRYYHLYQKGELEQNAEAAGGIVVSGGYERDNWYAIIRKP